MLGTLRLPLLVALAGSPQAAAGTNVAISAAAAASGAYGHAREGNVDWRVIRWMAPPSVAGAVLGALAGDSVPETALLAAISAVLVWNALDLLLRPVQARPAARPRAVAAVASGFAIGLLGGAIGVILGTLRMPALLRVVGLAARQAVGTNLVVGCALGVFAFLAQALQLDVDWPLLGAGLPGALAGAWFGARATGRMSETTLRRAIGAALLVVAVAFAVAAARA